MRRVLCVATLAMLVAGALFAQNDPNAVLAEVNGQKVTLGEFFMEMGRLSNDVQMQVVQDNKARTELVNSIILRKLMLVEAKAKVVDTMSVVKEAVARAADDIYVQALLASMQQGITQPTDAEIKDYYDKNPKLFDLPTRYHLAQIAIKEQKTADAVVKDLRAGKVKWEDALKQHSPDSPAGGDGGWLFEDQIVPNALTKVKALKPNEISDAIDISGMFYIVKLLGTEQPRKVTLDEAKQRIAQVLSQQKGQQVIGDYQNGLMMKAKITIDNAAVEKINFGTGN